MSSALKDVINAAAGITTFAVESARDLVQYMVRRGQMTQDEADKLIREAEAASQKRPKPAARPEPDQKSAASAAKRAAAKAAPSKSAPAKKAPARKAPAAKKVTPKKR